MQQFRMDRGLLNSFILFLLLLLAAAFVLLRIDFLPEKELQISGQHGEMRLAFWYPNTSAPLSLDAEWLGFPDQLLSPEEVERNLASSVPIRFPDVWQPPKPRRHVMTYTLMLKRIPQGAALGLKIPEIKNSFRLFLNDREIASGGFASDDLDQHEAYFGDRIVRLGVLPENARLTLQVSNFGHNRGGVHDNPVLATDEFWTDYYRFNILVECVVISLAVIAGFLILLEFYLVPEHRELLWFSLFSLVLAGYIGTSGLGGFATLMPGFPWQIAVRMEYIGFAAAIPLFLNWLASLYKEDLHCKAIRWLSWISLGMTAFVLLTPSSLFTGLLYPMLIFMCVSIGVSAWAMVRLVIRNRSGIRILVVGALALICGILHDLLLFIELVHGRNLLGLGVLVFLVCQLGFLTFYRTQEQLRILDLNKNLNEVTEELEGRIRWRTEELEIRAEELERRREEANSLLRHDELTGLLNRHHFLELIERRIERMPRLSYSLIIIDIDRYKLIVDQHGREFAEGLLREMADYLRQLCGSYFDRIPARYGGDEFIIWLGRCSVEQAEELAKVIRKEVTAMRFPVKIQSQKNTQVQTTAELKTENFYRCTVSTGVASAAPSRKEETPPALHALLARAADAVHRNRHLSRNPSSAMDREV
ncbi:GGDEF domain-containing protein [Oceanospirillum sanctuarii]|uniref:GGDEF domain-containing protein n=1 Tax=Oceanospirillum sanctuarii TaxID=1434821 RepID=UPI000A38B49A|nr:diguanylate cyclase [Oceanospirillum sanctuarii]